MTTERTFPLGPPTNRPKPAGPKPIPGRPNWFQPPGGGEPYYVEPPKPVLPDPQDELEFTFLDV
jgi:hypothetical protein